MKAFFRQAAGKRLTIAAPVVFALIMLFAFFSGRAYAETPSGNLFARNYGASDGLQTLEINAIAQTDDGYIWAAAYSGLYRFDGVQFSPVFKENKILSVLTLFNASDGRLWIGTNDIGAACYDPKTQKLKIYSSVDGLGSNSIHCICEDNDGNIYLGTTNSLDRIGTDGKVHSFDKFSEVSYIRSLCCLDSGIVVGATNAGRPFCITDGQPHEISGLDPGTYISTVGKLSDKHALLATSDNRIYDVSFEKKDPEFKLFCTTGKLYGLSAVKKLPDSDLYYVCADNGLGYIDEKNDFHMMSVQNFSMMICDVLEDYQGNLWFASNKQGIVKLSDNPFSNPVNDSVANNRGVNSITEINDVLVAGCDDGIFSFSPKTGKTVTLPWQSHFDDVRIRNIMYDSKQNIWVSTYNFEGLVRISPSGEMVSFNEQTGNAVGDRFRFSKELSDGTVLAASSTGLTFIDGTKTIATLSENDGLKTTQILDACETPDGRILAGSDGDGVYVIKNRKIVGHIGAAEGLESLVILKIVPCTGGYLYLTSTSIYYDNGNEVRTLNNIPYNNCYDAYITEDGQLWLTSSAGVYATSEEDLLADSVDYPYVLFNQFRGLDATLTANASNYVSPDGEVFLCTSDGIRKYSIPEINSENGKKDISAYIQSIVADGTEITPDENGVYQMPSGTKRITVSPAVLNYNLSSPKVHVWLEGFDETGITYSQKQPKTVSFTNISHGKHELKLQVLNEKDNTVIKEVSAVINRKAAFHETVWFYLIIVFLAAVITWMYAEIRHYQVIKEQYAQIKDAKEEAEMANQSKSFFLAKMSHDIRTPINSIMGMNEMILEESDSDVIRGYARDIAVSGRTLNSLIDEILDLTKLESQKLELKEEEYSMSEMISEVFSTLKLRAGAKGLEVVGDFDEKLPARVIGDELRIKEVLLNLISNAVKYTEEGSVKLSVSLAESNAENVRITFSVKDTGHGIPKESRKRIFDAFERLDADVHNHIKGTGLGLNISKQILEAMDSTLQLESEVGAGSEFFFTILQQRASEENIGTALRPDVDQPAERASFGHCYRNPDASVLIVDDTPLNLKVATNLLKRSEVMIDTAESGTGCIDMVRQKKYDLILLDDMMDDMTGREVLKWIKDNDNLCSATPVVVLTANALVGAREDYLAEGFDDYLPKPVSMAALEGMLIKYVGGNKNDRH